MGFYDTLVEETSADFEELFRIPVIANALRGDVSLTTYRAFLEQAYHHVKHTVPLLMAVGSRLGEERAWLQPAICEYIAEEQGHELWILDDLETCGADRAAVLRGNPDLPCEVMVAYAYDLVQRRDPIAFFGMVHVLEGASVRWAAPAATQLGAQFGLPETAFRYLASHGALDVDHVAFFEQLMNRIVLQADRDSILAAARVFARLYGNLFRALPA